MKYFKNIILTGSFLYICIFSKVAFSETPYVNILTWWGYLDSPWIKQQVLHYCNVRLSYDSYNSNDEFLRRWKAKKADYDIIIFSYTLYPLLKNEISLKNSNVSIAANLYNPIIREHFLKNHFSKNIAYFQHSLTGFIWNPKIITLKQNDDISNLFKKAKTNSVIIIDDPAEAEMLIRSLKINNYYVNIELNANDFMHIIQNSNVFISNELNNVYDQKNFAFAYQWSGIWLAEYKNKPNYHFLINKHLSYISTDLVAQIKNNKNAACVSQLLASKKFLSKLQNESYYFSPYGNIDTVSDNSFKQLYADFLKQLPKLTWIKPTSANHLQKITREWDIIKYRLSQ